MFLLNLLFFFFFQTPLVFAIDDFTIDQKINYSVTQTGDANVSHEVTLTNNLSEIYPKEYQLTLIGTNIKNVTGSDTKGNVVQKTNQLDNNTLIFIRFNQASVGKGKSNKFILNYQISELASHKGSVWDIQLPDFKNIHDSDTINISLNIPSTFGHLAYSSIPNLNTNTLGPKTQIELNQADIKDKKTLFIFGNYQLFDFNLKYFLENSSNNKITSEISLPPDTSSQKIVFREINPTPENIRVDQDGNWLAQYQLEPNSNTAITVQGQAKIYSENSSLSTINNKDYLSAQNFWPVNDPSIQKIAQKLNSPKDIYNYVVDTLSYNYENIDQSRRKGALEALLNPNNSLCTEFTDVFVTIARAKNIPAREIEGYAYSNNIKIKPVNISTDVLHAWPQYYDSSKQTWINIDPTWAKTTNGIDYFNDLDLNHLTFVIHGLDSEKPLPPGAYKNNHKVKTVSVNFATTPLKETSLPPVITTVTDSTKESNLLISNPNQNSINQIKITIPNTNWSHDIDSMPPYSSVKINTPKLSFIQSILPKNKDLTFKIDYSDDNDPFFYKTPYMPHYLNLTITIGIIIFTLSFFGVIFTFRRKSHKP